MNGRVAVVLLVVVSVTASHETLLDKWHSWKVRYRKVYSNDREAAYRKQIWLRNIREISHHNSENHTYVMKLNLFSDLVSLLRKQFSACQLFGYVMNCYFIHRVKMNFPALFSPPKIWPL